MALTDLTLMYSELLKLEQSPMITLVTLDLNPIGGSTVLRFVASTTRQGENVHFQNNAYTPIPLEVRGMGIRSTGQQIRPTIAFSNFPDYMRQIVLLYRDLVGAKISIIHVFEKHLDGGSSPNPDFYFGPDEFFVYQKLGETRAEIEFELVTWLDLQGVKLPQRTIQNSACRFIFRGTGCLFAEPVVLRDKNNKNISGFTGEYRGPWTALGKYPAGDAVRWTASNVTGIYRAKNEVGPSSSNPATDTSNWERVQKVVGEYSDTGVYAQNDVVWLTSANLEFTRYFTDGVASVRHYFKRNTNEATTGIRPPHKGYWDQDVCFKTLAACSLHHDPQGTNEPLPYGAFPGTANLPDV